MRGARRMLPDPDWKADDQPVRARTIGGNNDNDDDQGGDMLVRKVRRVLRRRKTPRRNQPSPRRAQAMLSVDKSMIQDLHKKDSIRKKLFDRTGRHIIVGEFFMKNGLLYQKH